MLTNRLLRVFVVCFVFLSVVFFDFLHIHADTATNHSLYFWQGEEKVEQYPVSDINVWWTGCIRRDGTPVYSDKFDLRQVNKIIVAVQPGGSGSQTIPVIDIVKRCETGSSVVIKSVYSAKESFSGSYNVKSFTIDVSDLDNKNAYVRLSDIGNNKIQVAEVICEMDPNPVRKPSFTGHMFFRNVL